MRLIAAVALAALAGVPVAGGAPASETAAGSASAGAGSIVYLKGGKLGVAGPDGRAKWRVPHRGSFLSASQADNGTIVAQRGIYFHRLSRRGKALSKPITTAFRTSPLLPAFNGPFRPEVSPDGKKIAYTYSFVASHYDPACACYRTSPSMNTAFTYATRFVEWPDKVFGSARFHSNGVAGCDDIQTLQMYRLDEGEMTRQRDKLVFVSGALNGSADGSRMQIHPMAGMPPAIPATFCEIGGANGRFASPTWSPDGKSLAWADAKGIWVGRVGDISGQTCQLTRRLVVPGGSSPDWGPAKP
jgi:hypothetical protein